MRILMVLLAITGLESGPFDLSKAVVVRPPRTDGTTDQAAAQLLVEEIEKRSGIRLVLSNGHRPGVPSIVLTQYAPTKEMDALTSKAIGADWLAEASESRRPEGFRIRSILVPQSGMVIAAIGTDARGLIFAVGHLLRQLEMRPGSITLPRPLDVTQSPVYRLRGHQLGYRNTANSYDAWNDARYEQYIRELAIFGTNAVENIPFQDNPGPHMPITRRAMNVRMSEICQRYGLEYWVWTPAPFDLTDKTATERALAEHDALYRACKRLDGVFFPGGDPGDNHPKLVMPFLADVAKRLAKRHPDARVWISLQKFDDAQVDYFFDYLTSQKPDWLGGVVHGPSSPPLADTRRRLDQRYPIRHYPDITHCVRCQYPVPWWDPAFEVTLGREGTNPRPVDEQKIHNYYAPYTCGFLTYSDGIHDDVNKVIWSRLGWEPQADIREILIEYARFFFGPDVAVPAADGILALECNWRGPLATNGGVDATLALWRDLEKTMPQLASNWRWQQCLLRAYYDAYTRHRLVFESRLEDAVNATLGDANTLGADRAMDRAMTILQRADTEHVRPEWRKRVEDLCVTLFESIGLQSSFERFGASGRERGCVLDDLDEPLNNRRWLEDEFTLIRKLPDEKAKLARLDLIRTWEHPGPGSFYDDVGNVAKSQHVLRGEEMSTDPAMVRNPNPGFWAGRKPRSRLSWISNMDWPIGMRYQALDPAAKYVVRLTGYRDSLLRIDGKRVMPTLDGKLMGEFKEFPVPQEALADGTILLTWDVPHEPHLNWREQSRLTEVWLLKQ